jgi:hypothetical protein
MQTKTWSRPEEDVRWLRAQPGVPGTVGPRLQLPGAGAFRTQPDGLWVTLGIAPDDEETRATFVDCFVVESCRTSQNFNDKRSRYAARTTSLVLELPKTWLDRTVQVQAGAVRQRRALLRGKLPRGGPVSLPVRHLRVLYALPDDDGPPSLYSKVCQALALEAHEYICPQTMLGQFNLQAMQRFLKRIAPGLLRYP